MFFGGTNFAFNSGANDDGTFQPTTTSYDYCAPLNEQGEYTDVYFKIRELLWSIKGENPPVLPPVSSAQKAGDVFFNQSSSLKANEKTLGEFKGYFTNPPSLEECGFSHGVIEYKTRLTGKYFDYDEVNAEYLSDVIKVDGIGDVAYVYENGEYLGKFDRVQNTENSGSFKLKVADDSEISVLVDTYGHTNYGKKIIDPKGIKGIYVWNQRLFGYETVCYPLDSIDSIDWSAGIEEGAPAFLKGEFAAEAGKKCFIMPKGLTRGYIWLNGFNLGRYNSMGPQKALYAPAALLKEKNEIVVLEFENIRGGSVEIVDSPVFEKGGKV